ncbi:recombinase family protein [Amycolatopsis sp. NPDC051128]|uniref:recombinase family protein n=1 Tax=Amycolatopsis sp. NPDC051128 TaxID=3155412 RepID=UPI0034146BA5
MGTAIPREGSAVIYLRSCGNELDPRQHSECLRIAERSNLTVLRVYRDIGTPARLERQTDLQSLLDDLAQLRDARYVIVWNYPRIGHDLAQINDVSARLHACDAEIMTITGVEAAARFIQGRIDDDGRR